MSVDFLGKGLRFPFAFQKRSGGAQVSTITSTDHAHIHESILQILGTRPGERFMNPEFGSHMRDLVFEPNGSVLRGLLRHYIIDDVERWEKRVYVTDVSFDESPEAVDGNTLYIRISYRVIDTQVEGNLVWPFCREEMTGSSDTGTRRVAVG
ncbi:MAG: GPW/gp25 family protein [Armatimonadetes bacterium]|jgi:phage baseplate assembly protein W|nr:GPW/gp25 family protein [Armatimonadota bacterium]